MLLPAKLVYCPKTTDLVFITTEKEHTALNQIFKMMFIYFFFVFNSLAKMKFIWALY